jgi:Metallo-beta-lactamase superfamily
VLRVEMLPARQGDALWIEWGDAHRLRRMLIDAGTAPTFTTLRERILALAPEERHFELLIVSHIDSDHIGGVLPLLTDETLGITFADIWFNGYRHLPRTPLQSLGPVEGERLTELLARRDWNAAFDGRAVAIPDDGALPVRELAGGLALTLLSPRVAQLAALRDVWAEVIRDHGLDPVRPEPERAPELPARLQELGAIVPDVAELAARPFVADAAKPNGSSIALLAEYECSSVLLAADAFPSVLLSSIEALLADRRADRLALSALKLPHHGSRANIHLPLLERIACDRFLFSTNGAGTRHPNEEAVARALVTHEKPELLFNYTSDYNAVWRDPRTVGHLGYRVRYPKDAEAGLGVVL